ncbi:uncharacterized protein SPAPADRAFT_140469 [Spathaspora passalidarum NRRL Y-27907]|uniref:Protein RMD9, mitochondrial n=1 Tax=Spathaspora passalidarum (strain NRRL Y-27907 / 11-Y1) TaxID=619300 RepID=G3ARM6_SPAPN|nr:uncharacterized protein SPAPADRAFT_140469 [Spathaspora passalidarum NRRL Y-27907]EGW31779.1 hypothetical protein SPAPADRAFT_140469 [Spathaspora passalidarum NRRL Y-27907]
MFKLITTNTQSSLRPALLQKIKNATANASQLSTSLSHTAISPVAATSPQIYPFTHQFVRNNSNVATKLNEPVNVPPPRIIPDVSKGGDLHEIKSQSEPSLLSEIDVKQKLDQFDQINLRTKYNGSHPFYLEELDTSLELLETKAVRDRLSEEQLTGFVYNIERMIFHQKRRRLRNNFNRDRDTQGAFQTEIMIQSAALKLFDMINAGSLTHCLSAEALYRLFLILHSFYLRSEIVSYWEAGVSNPDIANFFVDQKVLSTALFMAYEIKRFSYEEIQQIYDLNTPDKTNVFPDLLTSVGKVALLENDYDRALDLFEQLMISLERDHKNTSTAIAEMHLNFISMCREVDIAKHFFDKAYDSRKLPYTVKLKAPHMISFMRNCSEAGESMDEILQIWKKLLIKSMETAKYDPKGAKSANLNSGMFKLLFDKYPEYTEEAKKYLNKMFTMNPQINEIFINAAISNYSWQDRQTFDMLVDAYDKYGIPKTMMSNRIILKQAGLFDHSNEEIIEFWNNLLYSLDELKYSHIAVPDWAAIRDATILSEHYGDQRTGLYMSILKAYKDYMQNDFACVKFLRGFGRNAEHVRLLKKFTEGEPHFDNEVEITVPGDLHSLKKHIDFKDCAKRFYQDQPV